eukprot:3068182-Prymnesium_polylepis.1
MQMQHLQLIDLLTEDLRFAGAPERALTSLVNLRAESAVEDRGAFNDARIYRAATNRALDEQMT